MSWFGLVVIIALCLVAIFASFLAPYPYEKQNLLVALEPPSREHIFGTDEFGRDIFSRIVYGSRISIVVAVGSSLVSGIIGIILGTIGGYYGRKVDYIVTTLIDVTWSFPTMLLALVFVAVTGPSLRNVILAIGVIYWAQYGRVIRGQVLSVKEEEFVQASKAMGARDFTILIRHILPNVIAPSIVLMSLSMGYAITTEAMLSFLGVGTQPPMPSWGLILANGRNYMTNAPWLTVFPGLVIFVVVLGFNLLGDGLRDALDPYLRE
jgi:peptide/nickel transport system permease protein